MEPAEEHASEVRKLSTLLEASQALSATLDLEAGLQRVLEILGRHHGAVRSTVVLLNEQSGEVELQASAGAIPRGRQVRYAVGEGITGQVVATGKPIVVPRVSREPKFLSRAADRPELAGADDGGQGLDPGVVAPLVHDEQPAGGTPGQVAGGDRIRRQRLFDEERGAIGQQPLDHRLMGSGRRRDDEAMEPAGKLGAIADGRFRTAGDGAGAGRRRRVGDDDATVQRPQIAQDMAAPAAAADQADGRPRVVTDGHRLVGPAVSRRPGGDTIRRGR